MNSFAATASLRYASSVLAAAAAVLLALSAYLAAERWTWVSATVRTPGEVVSVQRAINGKGLQIIVSYTVAEQNYLVEADVAQFPTTYGLGDEVDVLYHRERPQTGEVANIFNLWGMTIILGIVGVSLLGVAVVARWIVRAVQVHHLAGGNQNSP